MTFTKNMSEENIAMFNRALDIFSNSRFKTPEGKREQALSVLRHEYPGVSHQRIAHQVERVVRGERRPSPD